MNAAADFDHKLARTFHASRYAERLCHARPILAEKLRIAGHEPFTTAMMQEGLLTTLLTEEEAPFHATLRHLRQQVMLRLIFRDINGLADFAEVAATISALADVTVSAALQFHSRAVARQFGLGEHDLAQENAQLVVVGMGKLGAHELNVSSDIDLIFVYANDGDASAARSWHEFHAETGKRVIRALDHLDENGFVFRVDMRLRPFGASGPLVSSVASLENYFQSQARPWERYAWLKARALTGGAATQAALQNIISPFVYRRYNDYGAIDEMRDLHAQIRAEALKKNRLGDIKVGLGGIREIEFIAQLFQLVRGGRDQALQVASTRQALALIGERGLVSPEKIERLQQAYLFLRNLEHRLQYLDDAQTQALPSGEHDRERIALAMNFSDWGIFEAALNIHRETVTAEFESLFATAVTTATTSSAASSITMPIGLEANIHAVLAINSIGHADAVIADLKTASLLLDRVRAWQQSSRTQTLSPKIKARMEALIPAALKASLTYSQPAETFFRLLDLLDAIDKRETYLALLMEYPHVLPRIARIAATSAWAADFLKRHPILLDELITAEPGTLKIDWPTERTKLQTACDLAANDTEKQYELLRHTKQVITLKLNIADIEGRLGVMAVSDELSTLADMLLNITLALVNRALNRASGAALNWNAPIGFAIIGYGKLGSKELGYASDLDLVFLVNDKLAVENDQFSRIAQRLSSWLNTMTAGGVLYETDLRLRPDGASGLLVSSLDAFRDYQLNRAWTWEHQALTRARWCAGDISLTAPFDAIRKEVLSKTRDKQKLKTEIIDMRDKMRAEKKDRADALDLKHTRGGIVDVEFIVQYLILAYSQEHQAFLGNLGNFALLMRAGSLGILDEDIAAKVAKAYLAYRERQHRARNNNQLKTWIGLDELAEERRAVVAAWAALLI